MVQANQIDSSPNPTLVRPYHASDFKNKGRADRSSAASQIDSDDNDEERQPATRTDDMPRKEKIYFGELRPYAQDSFNGNDALQGEARQ